MPLNEAAFRKVAQRAGMSFYPWEPLPAEYESDLNGDAQTDRGIARLNRTLSPRQAELTYLHECCHLIAHRHGLEGAADGWIPHTPHFAVLLAVCYKRNERLHSLKLYDFGDTADITNGKPVTQTATRPGPDAMAQRLRYILRTCERYAQTSMSIEDIAADLASQLRAATAAAQAAKRRKTLIGNWSAGMIGVMLSLGVLAGGRALGLI